MRIDQRLAENGSVRTPSVLDLGCGDGELLVSYEQTAQYSCLWLRN